jgi:DNA-binding transcriptional LysR family regulator
MIKLETLRVFISVAKLGNIKEAARKLGRTASAISMTLKQLEDEVGSPLFASDRKSSLTALGAFMLETGRPQVRGYDRTIAKIQAYAENKIGSLSLASIPSVAINIIPVLLPTFVASRPDVEIELFDGDTRAVEALVESGQADIGFGGQPASDAIISFSPLFRDKFKVVCNEKNQLATISTPLEWTDLEGQPLILNGASNTITAPGYQGLRTNASITISNISSLMAHTKAGLGISLIPASTARQLPKGVVSLPLADTSISRCVGILERRDSTRDPTSQAFIEYLMKEIPKLIKKLELSNI